MKADMLCQPKEKISKMAGEKHACHFADLYVIIAFINRNDRGG